MFHTVSVQLLFVQNFLVWRNVPKQNVQKYNQILPHRNTRRAYWSRVAVLTNFGTNLKTGFHNQSISFSHNPFCSFPVLFLDFAYSTKIINLKRFNSLASLQIFSSPQRRPAQSDMKQPQREVKVTATLSLLKTWDDHLSPNKTTKTSDLVFKT